MARQAGNRSGQDGSCAGLPALPLKKMVFLIPYNKSFIDQAFSIKTAGYLPRSVFFSVYRQAATKKNLDKMRKLAANCNPYS